METNELITLLQNRLTITVTTDTEWEYSGEYGTVCVELTFRDDDGEEQIISRGYDTFYLSKN